mmetsp:Transcript_98264/g.282554  ORF Transcript_98264/g.282554 Transcript_98264/m.282554 type:complete len:338 (-) Transcript_98264:1815-2828(-)
MGDGLEQARRHLGLRATLGKVQCIEARGSHGERAVEIPSQGEALDVSDCPIAWQVRETADGRRRAARGELQQVLVLLHREPADHAPKQVPSFLLDVAGAVGLPVLQIHLPQPADQQVELVGADDALYLGPSFLWNNGPHASEDAFDLRADRTAHPCVAQKLDIVMFVLLRDMRLGAAGVELVSRIREDVRLRDILKGQVQVREGHGTLPLRVLALQQVLHLVLVELGVHGGHVLHGQGPSAEQHLAQREREACGRERFLVHQRERDELADELEVGDALGLGVRGRAAGMQGPAAVHGLEEAELHVAQRRDHQPEALAAVSVPGARLVAHELHLDAML